MLVWQRLKTSTKLSKRIYISHLPNRVSLDRDAGYYASSLTLRAVLQRVFANLR